VSHEGVRAAQRSPDPGSLERLSPPGSFGEPAFVVETARTLSEVKGVAGSAIAAATRANTLRLFAKMDREGRA